MVALAMMVALGVTPRDPAPESEQGSPTELIVGISYDDGIPTRERKQLGESFDEALAKACAPPPCVKDCRKDGRTLGVEVGGDSRDYTLHWVATDPRLDAPLVLDSSCELCSLAEVEEQLAADLGALCTRLDALDGAPGRLKVTSDPSGARVSVDGQRRGKTPWKGELAAGEHQLELRARGRGPEQRTVLIVAGIEGSEHIELLVEAKQRPIWPAWTSLGVGFALSVAGAALIAAHGKEWTGDCEGQNLDANGHCKFVYDTRPLGIGLAVVGVGALAAGVGLTVWAERDGGRLSSLGVGIKGRF